MKIRDEILTILMEECAETSIECSKVIRFNIHNTERLEKELGDVLMMVELLSENNYEDIILEKAVDNFNK